MKFIAAGDIHFTDKCPRNRCDDYAATQLRKFEFMLSTARDKTEQNLLVVAGDLFDKPNISYKMLSDIAALIDKYDTKILCVPGQHDLRYHNKSIHNTPMGFMHGLRYVHILDSQEYFRSDYSFIGKGWGEELKIKSGDVLVTHEMVVANEALFPGQLDFITGKEILKKYDFSIIISGDNHKPHVIKTKSQININTGSMMRSNKSQLNYKPAIWLVDTEEVSCKKIGIPIENSDKVFDYAKIELDEQRKESKKEMEALLSAFNSDDTAPNFEETLKLIIKRNKPNKQVVAIINSLMEECV